MRPNQNIPDNYQNNLGQYKPPMQQNYQRQENYQMQQNQQMQRNYQMQQNCPMQQNQPIQQNCPMQQNQPIQQNCPMQQNQPIQQNCPMQQNQPIQQNCPMQQNQPMQQNYQMQNNQQMQQPQQYAGLQQTQSRPIPPIPSSGYQPTALVRRCSSQKMPLKPTSSNGSMMSLQSSGKLSSMQSMDSSDSEPLLPCSDDSPQTSQQVVKKTHTFDVVYNNITYKVDPELLADASARFKEMVHPYIENNERLNGIHLEVLGDKFSYRNMNNFLKLCQNLPTDVENSEMEEICEIAKMFGAEKIYNTGVAFIQQNLDANFSVPDNKYDGSDGKKYLFIHDENRVLQHSNETENENSEGSSNDGNDVEDDNTPNEIQNNAGHDQVMNDGSKKEIDTSRISSVIYMVKRDKRPLKLPVYHFYDNGTCLFTAKRKDNNIYIGEGFDVHINKNMKNHVAHIYQDDALHSIVFLKDMNFKIKYVNSGKPNHLSLDTHFTYNNREIKWSPKTPKYDAIKDKYYLNFHGEHHHTPIGSRKNIVLQNDNGNTTFIVRKMDEDMFEIECLPLIDPLIIFAIGLSDIMGPYIDPLAEIEF